MQPARVLNIFGLNSQTQSGKWLKDTFNTNLKLCPSSTLASLTVIGSQRGCRM